MTKRTVKSITDIATDLATDLAEDTRDEIVEYATDKLDPVLDELLALRDEVAALRKAVSSTKSEVVKFKKSLDGRFEVLEIVLEHMERLYQFLKKIPFLRKMF